ncbi:MAG: twin-arginine translocation pathway signal protein, partial [Pseudomonadota bacterium]|nr:twin-arginine translocation pathway signal protein [Pseudomonadota bacterium]
MTLTRRKFLSAGAAAGVAAMVPQKVFAAVAPLQPRIDPRLKARALLALAARRSRIRNADVIGIADFTRPSRDPRFYIVDVRSGMITEHLC